jgi:hypothetical protein
MNPILDNHQSARYEDSSYSTIIVEWISPEDKKLRTHSIPVDESNTDYNYLINDLGWTEERLQKQTIAYKKQASRDMNFFIRKAATELAEEAIERRVASKVKELNDRLTEVDATKLKVDQTLSAVTKEVDNSTWEKIFDANDDKDEIFKFKLWALEQDAIKDATSEQKKQLRQQTTLFGCVAKFNELIS